MSHAETTTLTLEQYRAIEWHTNNMIAASTAAIGKFRQIPPAMRDEQVVNTMTYHKHAIGAFKWLLGVAKQRCPACRNVI